MILEGDEVQIGWKYEGSQDLFCEFSFIYAINQSYFI